MNAATINGLRRNAEALRNAAAELDGLADHLPALTDHDRLIIVMALCGKLDDYHRRYHAPSGFDDRRTTRDAAIAIARTLARFDSEASGNYHRLNARPEMWQHCSPTCHFRPVKP